MSVETISWARHQRARDHIAKHVLLTLATMADWKRCEVYFSQNDQAEQCQLNNRSIRRAWTSLHEDGLITVVRRIRANGASALPTILLNCPGAPHMNGEPVALDYRGHWLFPEDPDAVHADGISWISATDPGRVHPKHSEGYTVDGVTYAPPAARQRGGDSQSGGEGTDSPEGGDSQSPPGGDSQSPLTPCTDSRTFIHGPSAGAAGDGDGVSDEQERKNTGEPSAPPEPARAEHDETAEDRGGGSQSSPSVLQDRARELLSSLRMPQGAPFNPHSEAITHVAAALEAEIPEGVITEHLMSGAEDAHTPAAIVTTNARGIPSLIAQRDAHDGTEPATDVIDRQIRTLRARGEDGARQAAFALGLDEWPRPAREPDQSPRDHLLAVRAAAQGYIDAHHAELRGVLTGA